MRSSGQCILPSGFNESRLKVVANKDVRTGQVDAVPSCRSAASSYAFQSIGKLESSNGCHSAKVALEEPGGVVFWSGVQPAGFPVGTPTDNIVGNLPIKVPSGGVQAAETCCRTSSAVVRPAATFERYAVGADPALAYRRLAARPSPRPVTPRCQTVGRAMPPTPGPAERVSCRTGSRRAVSIPRRYVL